MSGKIVAVALILSGLIAGAVLYYLQIYGFYREVTAPEDQRVQLVSLGSGAPEDIAFADFSAIDADSSPIRYRACFTTDTPLQDLRAGYETADIVTPRNAPGWFSCFDAAALGAALKSGEAQAFLCQKNIRYGVDRVVAIDTAGRGFVWHELNACGTAEYDGAPGQETCPPRPETQ